MSELRPTVKRSSVGLLCAKNATRGFTWIIGPEILLYGQMEAIKDVSTWLAELKSQQSPEEDEE